MSDWLSTIDDALKNAQATRDQIMEDARDKVKAEKKKEKEEAQQQRINRNPRLYLNSLIDNVRVMNSFLDNLEKQFGTKIDYNQTKYIVIVHMHQHELLRQMERGTSWLLFENVRSIFAIQRISLIGVDAFFDEKTLQMAQFLMMKRDPFTANITMILASEGEVVKYDTLDDAKKEVREMLKTRFGIK